MRKFYYKKLSQRQIKELIYRKAVRITSVKSTTEKICRDVLRGGLNSAIKHARILDNFSSKNIYVTENEFKEAEELLPAAIKSAIEAAYKNIRKFHQKQYPKNYKIETTAGVNCERKFIPIENVGLYIPAGNAPLPSTMLMLGIPAQIAGCKRIVAASPTSNKINPSILFAARLCGIREIIKIGGAQSIALLAYGGNNLKKVDKIFGPGNQYVTTAKSYVSSGPEGCAIDMISGPSELMIIADKFANPAFVAADLLSQAEHGNDSIVSLLTNSGNLFIKVKESINYQIKKLQRKRFAKTALAKSFCLFFESINDAFSFSNEFAPEHLILNLRNPNKYLSKVVNAGSVFIGEYTPESAGDYASGTNHALPTYGFARSNGGVSVEMFMKGITFQSITKNGLKNLSETIITLAEIESLKAHAEAVKIRLK